MTLRRACRQHWAILEQVLMCMSKMDIQSYDFGMNSFRKLTRKTLGKPFGKPVLEPCVGLPKGF